MESSITEAVLLSNTGIWLISECVIIIRRVIIKVISVGLKDFHHFMLAVKETVSRPAIFCRTDWG